jgi:hypothetical protein
MAWTKTTRTIVLGTVVLALLAATTVAIVFRHQIGEQITLAGGRHAIASHQVTPVDMTPNYTTPASYFPQITSFPAWSTVPTGFHVFNNVPLQIDGMLCLWGADNANKLKIIFPEQILGIAVNQKFETLYVYHGAFFSAPDNTPVYDLVFRYADGSSATNQLRYRSDILDWGANSGRGLVRPTGPNTKLAWVGGSFAPGKKQPVCFCLTAIKNPQPSLEVASIDLFSCKSQCAPCILAMTAGRPGLMK